MGKGDRFGSDLSGVGSTSGPSFPTGDDPNWLNGLPVPAMQYQSQGPVGKMPSQLLATTVKGGGAGDAKETTTDN